MKLYKYRSIRDKEKFNYYLKALSEGYLWFADIRSLNDPSDSMIYYDREKEEELFITYILYNKVLIYRSFLKHLYKQIPQMEVFIDSISDDQLLTMINTKNKEDFNEFFPGTGATDEDIITYDKAKKHFDELFKQKEDKYKEMLKPIFNFNDTYRHTIKVFSMSGSYNNKYLWDKYAEDYGFCIEYDSNRITEENIDLKDLYPVNYSNEREHFSWLPLFLFALKFENQDNYRAELEMNLKNQLLSKGTIWDKENEYRFITNKGNIIQADIVSGIILDENILGTTEANQLVKLSYDRKWKLSIWLSKVSKMISYQEYISKDGGKNERY